MADRSLDRYQALTLREQAAIDRLCSRYEAALLAGEGPSLEGYVREAGMGDPSCLLAELLAIDLDYRGRRGETPTPSDYAPRFPAFADLIAEAFQSSATARQAQAAPPGPPRPPEIDGYEILGELGKGGMGVVYKARDGRLKRLVALKMILQGDFASEQHRARFLVESEMLGRLRHPNVVQVFGSGEQGGRPFLALEYVEGGTLAQRLAGGGLPQREAAALVAQLARGVHHAHLQGVIHRDVKPANVLMSPAPDGAVPKITDFGLACAPGGGEVSLPGQVLGTPSYMSPEQARGERQALGPAADVYSLGAVLYEALTGKPPFRGATPLETVRQVLADEPPPPASLRPGLDADLVTVCLKCLRKEPEGRYPSAAALADDLERWLAGKPVSARPAGVAERAWKWARRSPAQAGLVAVSLLLVLAVIGIPTAAALRLAREQELTRRADEQRRLALVQSLHAAAPESVPFLVEALAPAPDQVLPLIREQLADPATRLRAAVALTLLGEDQTDYLVSAIPTAPAAESGNFARAFLASSAPGLADELHRRARTDTDLNVRMRHVILSLDLGDTRTAREMFGGTFVAARSAFLEEVASWHGTLARLPAIIDGADDDDFRSAVCAAAGRVDPARLDPEVRRSIAAALARRYQDAPDPGTHAAAEWSLRRWGVDPPAIKPAEGRRWFVNSAGMTMMGIPAGVLRRNAVSAALLTRPYFIGGREVTLGQFRQFLDDGSAERPDDWRPIPEFDKGPGYPLHNIRLNHVALFCNWLSKRERRRPCYRHDAARPGGWACDLTADGYRLPTEVEWDHAQRAGASGRFFFGPDARWLPLYGQVAQQAPAPCGAKLPNRWGLFDVVGNMWEATNDEFAPIPGGAILDPRATGRPATHVIRGGGYDSGSKECLAWTREEGRMDLSFSLGFRVVCGSAAPTEAPLPKTSDGRAALALLHDADDAVLVRLRGELHARFGEWGRAAADLGAAAKTLPAEVDLLTTYAAVLVKAGGGPEYAALRRRLLDTYGNTEDPLDAERVAKACLLADGDGMDRILRLLKTAMGRNSQPWARPYAELAQGMAEYRRGDHKEALVWLTRCQQLGRPLLNDECQALRGCFMAMTLYRLGQTRQAGNVLLEARTRLKHLEATKEERAEDSWKDRLRASLAEAEAKAVLLRKK